MDKRLLIGLLSFVVLLYFAGIYLTFGAEKNEVTLTGELVCGHCALHAVDNCAAAVKAADGNYLLVKNPESDKVFGERFKGLTAKVTGVVEEKDGRKWITASKIELEK